MLVAAGLVFLRFLLGLRDDVGNEAFFGEDQQKCSGESGKLTEPEVLSQEAETMSKSVKGVTAHGRKKNQRRPSIRGPRLASHVQILRNEVRHEHGPDNENKAMEAMKETFPHLLCHEMGPPLEKNMRRFAEMGQGQPFLRCHFFDALPDPVGGDVQTRSFAER